MSELKELKETQRKLKNVKQIFIAFNSNIDNIKCVDKSFEEFGTAKPKHLTKIKNEKDIFSSILYSMKFGEALELPMNEKTQDWINKNIKPERRSMGGQAGIMANFIATLGIQPLVFTPLLSDAQKKLFNKKILFVDKGLKHINQVHRKDKEKSNWVFEFRKGQKLCGIKARGNNRFIASSRPDEFKLRRFSLNFDFDCAILSGFQNIKRKYKDGTTWKDQFMIAHKIIDNICKRGKKIHIEIASTKDKLIRKEVLKLASKINSIGIDESELIDMLRSFNERIAERIHKKHDIIDIYNGMKRLMKRIKTKKIHLHGNGFFLSMCRKEYHVHPNGVKKALEFANVVAAAVAGGHKNYIKHGIHVPFCITCKEKEKRLKKYLRKKGVQMKDGIIEEDYVSVLVPSRFGRIVKGVVGMGDIISSSTFVAEMGYLLD